MDNIIFIRRRNMSSSSSPFIDSIKRKSFVCTLSSVERARDEERETGNNFYIMKHDVKSFASSSQLHPLSLVSF